MKLTWIQTGSRNNVHERFILHYVKCIQHKEKKDRLKLNLTYGHGDTYSKLMGAGDGALTSH